MPCFNCGKDQIMAKGLCNACYIRQYRFGDLTRPARKPSTRKPKNNRSCKNCGTVPVAAHELCAKCYSRMLRTGHVSNPRPVNYGKVGKHPLKEHWHWIVRTVAGKGTTICEQWRGDIEQFALDVGERPTKNHVLRRIDESIGFEPGNVYWHKKEVIKRNDESTKEYARRYQKEYRIKCPQNIKNTILKKQFGITMDVFEQMQTEQNNLCAICGQPETNYNRQGNLMALHVDHCHTTNKIRGLLCSKCNTAIGLFREDIEIMQKAMAYIIRHK